MHTKHLGFQEYPKVLHWNDLMTSIYVPVFLHYLYYNNLILSIGQYTSIHNISFLVSLELIKYVIFIKNHKQQVNNRLKDFFKSLFVIFSFFVIVYVVTVLFGAAVFSNIEETCMFSLLITSLTAIPICLNYDAETAVNMFLSLTICDSKEIQSYFMLKLRLTLFGAWLGAIAIPLDWNRAWQNWPIPCCIGALLGYLIANWICFFLYYKQSNKVYKKTGKYAL